LLRRFLCRAFGVLVLYHAETKKVRTVKDIHL